MGPPRSPLRVRMSCFRLCLRARSWCLSDIVAARDRRGQGATIPSGIANPCLSLLAALHFHRMCSAQADVGNWRFRNCSGLGLLPPLLDPRFDLTKIPRNASVCEIETSREETAHLKLVDGCVAEWDDLTELLTTDGICWWGRGQAAL